MIELYYKLKFFFSGERRMSTLERIQFLNNKIKEEHALDQYMWFMPEDQESHLTIAARKRLDVYLSGITEGHYGD